MKMAWLSARVLALAFLAHAWAQQPPPKAKCSSLFKAAGEEKDADANKDADENAAADPEKEADEKAVADPEKDAEAQNDEVHVDVDNVDVDVDPAPPQIPAPVDPAPVVSGSFRALEAEAALVECGKEQSVADKECKGKKCTEKDDKEMCCIDPAGRSEKKDAASSFSKATLLLVSLL